MNQQRDQVGSSNLLFITKIRRAVVFNGNSGFRGDFAPKVPKNEFFKMRFCRRPYSIPIESAVKASSLHRLGVYCTQTDRHICEIYDIKLSNRSV